MKILIHSNGPHVPSGFGKQARLAGKILRELGHEVAFSCISGLGGQPIRWEGYTLFPMGRVDFGLDTLVEHAQTYGADVVVPIMDLWKLLPIAQKIADAPFMWAPLMIVDCEAPNGGPSQPEQQLLARAPGYPAGVSQFAVDRLAAVGVKTFRVPHAFDPAVFRRFGDDERAVIRRENGTDEKFVIGMCAANNDSMRKGYPETFAAFARFLKRHPDAMLNVFAVYDAPRGYNLPEMAVDMGIYENVMFMPSYAQVAGLLPDEFVAAWYNSIDVLSMASYGEGFGVPAVEAQACGTPVVATDCSALTELVRPAGWLVKGERFWNPVHRAWWTRPDEDALVKAYERAYREWLTDTDPAVPNDWSRRSARAAANASAYAIDSVRDDWAAWMTKVEQVVRVLAESETGVVTYDGLKWKAERLTEEFGDSLALEHERDYEPYILGNLAEGDVFVDVGAHVGHWTVRAAAKGARVIAVEADPVTAERLSENLKLNGLDAEIYATAAWDEVTELHLNHVNQEKYDGTNQVRPDGDGQMVDAEPLDSMLAHLDRIDLIKIDVEGADLHVLRGLRQTVARTRPKLFIEDHSVHGYFDRKDLEEILEGYRYQWDEVAPGYILAVSAAG